MTGTTRTSPTSPSASARWSSGASSETCHRIAAVCMKLPENETSSPSQRRRKFRCCSAGNTRCGPIMTPSPAGPSRRALSGRAPMRI